MIPKPYLFFSIAIQANIYIGINNNKNVQVHTKDLSKIQHTFITKTINRNIIIFMYNS